MLCELLVQILPDILGMKKLHEKLYLLMVYCTQEIWDIRTIKDYIYQGVENT